MKIECSAISYQYDLPGDETVIKDLSLCVNQGEKIAVIGPAGSGKTTLIQLLDALILPTKGDIFYDGISVHDLSRSKNLPSIRRRIGVLFQFPEHQFFHERAYDELSFAVKNFFPAETQEIDSRARILMERFHLDTDKLKEISPFNLSSGEKRKLALASALMTSPEVLILDEPTAGMDASGRNELIKIISSLSGTTVIVVTHNPEDFLMIADRVVGISGGSKVVDVPRDNLLDHLDEMEDSGIVPPLVLSVQRWLIDAGCKIDSIFGDMEELCRHLRGRA
ncbi:MAG TPA: ATP-binding cassette domain-containing protein [Deltaproteobacteria bacterium]|nr:ATP-binding cassette domain-containing protein [Deltaproteobacteria bacterium]